MPSEQALAAAREMWGNLPVRQIDVEWAAAIIDKHMTPPSSVAVRVPVAIHVDEYSVVRALCSDGAYFRLDFAAWTEGPPIPGTAAALERGVSDPKHTLSVATAQDVDVATVNSGSTETARSNASAGGTNG